MTYNNIKSMPEAISLTWKKLSASVKDKPILTDASGYCKPGELLAVMGPSGSGKTTFLSLLTHKTDPALTVSGNVSLY
jgi:ABC-type multidrug transport system ATPase subunit